MRACHTEVEANPHGWIRHACLLFYNYSTLQGACDRSGRQTWLPFICKIMRGIDRSRLLGCLRDHSNNSGRRSDRRSGAAGAGRNLVLPESVARVWPDHHRHRQIHQAINRFRRPAYDFGKRKSGLARRFRATVGTTGIMGSLFERVSEDN
jgi:hypothetical protein